MSSTFENKTDFRHQSRNLNASAIYRCGVSEELTELQTEYNNFRRKSRREIESAKYRGKAEMAVQLVGVIDDIEQALGVIEDENTREGLEKMKVKMIERFEEVGLHPFGSIGDEFDPEIHEAIAHVPGQKNQIVSVHKMGWETSFGKMIRVASISVGGA